jgi:predicted peptidase
MLEISCGMLNHSRQFAAIICAAVTFLGQTFVARAEERLPIVDQATDRLFTTQQVSYSLGGDEKPVKYRLHIPSAAKVAKTEKSWPLLVWLHGFGEAGDDNIAHIRWLNLLFRRDPADGPFPCFVMAYQCPYERRTWSEGPREKQPITVAKAIIDRLLTEYPIDANRIYLSGVSSGGTGCWEMLDRYPTLFAAAAPLASAGSPFSNLSALVDVPIWAFHTRDDPDTRILEVRQTVASLQSSGGKVYLTETPGHTHDCWNSAFTDFRFVDWLLTQKRGTIGPEPEYRQFRNDLNLTIQTIVSIGPQYYLPLPIAAVCLYWGIRRAYRKRS